MSSIEVTKEALEAVKAFTLPEDIGFGKVMAPVMIESNYDDGNWSKPTMKPYGNISFAPTAKVFHYAQEIFEGLKAYNYGDKGPFLFRPDKNAERFVHSAQRMAIPPVPVEMFIDGVKLLTSYCAKFVPKRTGESLYIRPFVFATEESLGIKPSLKYKFLIIASPSGAYFSSDAVPVYIEREAVRACPGGTGTAKTGGNYAASLLSSTMALERGYMQTLWLDAIEKKYIEEMSGMNFMCVIDGVLTTPELTETILDGITRSSILEFARYLGIKTEERKLTIDEITDAIKSGKCSEAFACGTAAIITPISQLGEKDGTHYELKEGYGPIATKLRKGLLDLQEGRGDDPFGWRIPIEPAPLGT